ncbi:hypothetical protein LCGC14_0996540 [marine sediment metagenome]|uniref:Uncharacterized protein n=1 Tax=marine sediment metagenome TaxID=412755 RepID=A0A0F9N8X3_9ZZZZ
MKKRDWGNVISFTLGIVIMWAGTNILSSQFITYLGLLVSILYGIEIFKEDKNRRGK